MDSPILSYEICWEKHSGSGAEDATWGHLRLRVGEDDLWGAANHEQANGIRWTWVDLLEHLAECWPWLEWEEGWPAGPRVADPRRFLADSQQWLAQLAPNEAAEQEDRLYEFRVRHDLAMAIRGKILPPLWVVRQGRQVWVAGPEHSALLPHEQVFSCLMNLGDDIAGRLKGLADERSAQAVDSWKRRVDIDRKLAVAISIGVAPDDLAELTDGDFASAFEIDPSADEFEPNELLAAARMAVPSTDSSVVRTIVAAMRAVKVCRTPELDELATRASACLANEAANEVKPAELGYKIARWVRDELGVADDEKVDPASMLRKWNVHVGELCVDDDGIEAVACWGRQHGPAILVNRSGRHSQDEAGRRATLAHEICHLLVDRSASLPLAEVFGGHVFRSVEQRAGAFAAQLLVPREMAGRAFLNARSPGDVLSSLAGKYGASRELIAWQTYNSGAGMNWGTFVLLRNQVSRPERFLWNVASGRR